MLDIRSLCAARNIPTSESGHHHTVGWVQLNCPLCSSGEHGWHLGFNLAKGYFHCWRCGAMEFWSTVGLLTKQTDRAAIRELVFQHQIAGTQLRVAKRERVKEVELPKNIGPLITPHKKYLAGRGFSSSKVIREWGLQATQHLSGGAWNWRIIIPIHDAAGRLVTYQGRSIAKFPATRYRTLDDKLAAAPLKSLLYGEHKVPSDSVVVVEGVMDVWRLGPGAVATFGIDWTPEQAAKISKYRRRFIMFDNESQAQRKALKLCEWLAPYDGETELVHLDSPSAKDPAELPDSEAIRLMAELGV